MISFWLKSGSLSAKESLVAKCWDLSDAYKQVPLSDEAFHLDSYLAVYEARKFIRKDLQTVCLALRVNSVSHSLSPGFACLMESWLRPSFVMVSVFR